jgi:hypothetical protein
MRWVCLALLALALGGCTSDGRFAPLVEKPPMATPDDRGSLFDSDREPNIFGMKLRQKW